MKDVTKWKPKGLRKWSMLKTILSLTLVLTIVFGNIVPLNVAKAEDSTVVEDSAEKSTEPIKRKMAEAPDLLNVDFSEDWSESGKLLGLGDAETPGKYEIKGDESNPYLKIINSAGTDMRVTKLFTSVKDETQNKYIVYEYMASVEDVSAAGTNIKLFLTSKNKAHLRVQDDGKIWFNGAVADQEPLATLATGEWVKLCMVVDYTRTSDAGEYYYRLYVNDCLVKDFEEKGVFTTITAPAGLSLVNVGHLLIDNIRIYEGTEPLDEYRELKPATAPDLLNVDFSEDWSESGKLLGLGDAETPGKYEIKGDESNTYLKIINSAGTDMRVTKLFTSVKDETQNKYIVYEYMASVEDVSAAGTNIKLFLTSKNKAHLRVQDDGKIWFNGAVADQEPLATLAAGEWVKLCMVVDYTRTSDAGEYYYRLYVNDRLVKDFEEKGVFTTITAPAGLSLVNVGHLLVDNIRIYEGTEPLAEYEEPEKDEEAEEVNLFELNFSETEADIIKTIKNAGGTTLAKLDDFSGAGYSVGIDPNDPTNKVFKMQQATKGEGMILTWYKVADGPQRIVYDFKVSAVADMINTADTEEYFGVFMDGTLRLASVRRGANKTSGTVRDRKGDAQGVYEAGTWTNIAIAANYKTFSYDLYINGEKKYTGTFSSSNTGLTFRAPGDYGPGAMFVDDLKVYEGVVPRGVEYEGVVGVGKYVDRTFDEIYKYDFAEITRKNNNNLAQIIKGTDGLGNENKYLKLEVKDAQDVSQISYTVDNESDFIVAQAKVSLESVSGNEGALFGGKDTRDNTISFLKVVGNSVQLPDGTEITTLETDSWKEIAVAVNVYKKLYDVYVDGQLVKADISYESSSYLSEILTSMSAGSMLLDDLRVYDEKEPKTDWVVNNTPDVIYLPDSFAEGLLGDAAAIQLNANVLYANKVKSNAIKPFDLSDEGKVYLAVDDIKTLFGADAVLNIADVKNGMYDVIAVAKANGYTYIHEMKDRMFVFSKTEIALQDETNEKEVNKYLQFDRPSEKEITDLFNQNVDANDGHPRVLITQSDVDTLKRLYNANHEYVKKYADAIIAAAEKALLSADFTYVVTGTSMADVDETRPMILNLGMAWLLTGDTRYAEKAWRMAQIICNLPDWNPEGYLDIGEFCVLIGVVYDWFYDWLSPEQRRFLEESIMEKGVAYQLRDYYKDCATPETYWGWWDGDRNFNAVGNGGTMVGAIAIFDKYPEECARVISNTLHGLEFLMGAYYPEGAWHEGTSYWGYTMGYLSYALMTFDNVFGDDFGFACSPGLEQSGWFGLSVTGSTGKFNYGDSSEGHLSSAYAQWCAMQFGDEELLSVIIKQFEAHNITISAHQLIYFDEELYAQCGDVELPLETMIKDNAIIGMRERWLDENATYLGVIGYKPRSGHSHRDTGNFVVDMLGERVIMELGANSYSADAYFSTYRYRYYRTRPEGHNLYIINPEEVFDDYGGHSAFVDAPVLDNASATEGAFAVVDLSNVYAEDTTSAIRGYMLMDDRRNVMIRDEITFKEGTTNTFYSFFHTKADVEIVDQSTAVLTMNGKKYKATIATNAENYTFSVVPAEPLFELYKLAGNSDNTGISKLQFFTDSASGQLTFTLRITAYDDPAADKVAADLHNVSFAQWDTLLTQDGEITELPTLDMIYVNGEELANFNPDTTGYTGQLASSAMLPIITASSETYERIEVIPATDFGKDYVIKVYDNKDENTYRVYRLNYTRVPELEPVDGRPRYPVVNGTASGVDTTAPNVGPEGAIDNDFTINSRWGVQGDANTSHWLMLELDEVSTVHKIGIAFAYGQRRYMHFKLEVSVDGENWTTVYDGLDTSLKTNELNTKLQYFYDSEEGIPAKFVRYSGPGGRKSTDTTVTNYWHHISEFVVLGPKAVTEYYEQGSNEALEMIYSGELTSVTLGEETVAAENYTVTAGNASVVSLKPEYLDALTAGTYELTMNYADGTSAIVTLEILPVGSSAVQIIPEGTVGSYELNSGETVTIHATGIKDELVGVMLNDALVDTENYEVTEGSTIVTFKNAYLDSLSAGTYKVTLLYSGDRSVESSLVIEAEETTTEPEETTTEAEETTTEAEETTTEAEETTTEAEETTTEAEETTTEAEETTTEAEETTTEADESTEVGTNAAPGGDPDTGDVNGAARWLWLVMVAAVVMTGYALGFERKKQK